MKECFKESRFCDKTLRLIAKANEIIAAYRAQGYELTLRQLYYQFVARDLIANTERSYKVIGNMVNEGRLSGLIDWDSIIDRTRNLRALSHWDTPADIIHGAARQYMEDLWRDQPKRVEVWIEKDALVGIVEDVCSRWDVPYFSCRGYVSQSEMYSAAGRLIGYVDNEQAEEVHVIQLSDHDPSGIDMTRDISDRLEMFTRSEITLSVDRIALTMAQIWQYNPPPNPAKTTDSRYENYIRHFGTSSWELDSLDPKVLDKMIEDAILSHLDRPLYDLKKAEVDKGRRILVRAANHMGDYEIGEEDEP